MCAKKKTEKSMDNSEWYIDTLCEPCVQNSLNVYLGDYSYLDGYTPSRLDCKVHSAFKKLCIDFEHKPNLERWFNHLSSYSNEERFCFRLENHRITSYRDYRDDKCGFKVNGFA